MMLCSIILNNYFNLLRCVVGHSYIVYGPLNNGVTTVMFESIPTYPNSYRCSGAHSYSPAHNSISHIAQKLYFVFYCLFLCWFEHISVLLSRYWDLVQKHKVTQFYTAPTAIRTLMRFEIDHNVHFMTIVCVESKLLSPILPPSYWCSIPPSSPFTIALLSRFSQGSTPPPSVSMTSVPFEC